MEVNIEDTRMYLVLGLAKLNKKYIYKSKVDYVNFNFSTLLQIKY